MELSKMWKTKPILGIQMKGQFRRRRLGTITFEYEWDSLPARQRIPISTYSSKPAIAKSNSLTLHANIRIQGTRKRFWGLVITTNEDSIPPTEVKEILQQYMNLINGRLINFKVELQNE